MVRASRLTYLLLAAFTLHCAPPVATPPVATPPAATLPQPASSQGITLQVPDSVGAFTRTFRREFDDPSQGVMFRYMRADSLSADVFVYPGPDLAVDCPMECARSALDDEITDFVSAFPEMKRLRYVDSIALHSDETLAATASDSWRLGRRLGLRIRRDGKDERSDFYLYYLPGYRVKVRASYVPDSARVSQIARFAIAVVPALVASEAPALPTGEHITVSTVLAGGPGAHFPRIVAALRETGYDIADSSHAAGRIVTAPKFTWPEGSEDEKWHGEESPGVVLTVSLSAQGDSTKVEILGRSPVRAGWKDAEVAQVLETLSVLQLANVLGEKGKPR